jgi:hypothetical protein
LKPVDMKHNRKEYNKKQGEGKREIEELYTN